MLLTTSRPSPSTSPGSLASGRRAWLLSTPTFPVCVNTPGLGCGPDSLHTQLLLSRSVTQRLAGQVTEMPQEGLGGQPVSPVGIGQGRLQASQVSQQRRASL